MSDRIRLQRPNGEEVILMCWVRVGDAYKNATCAVWPEDGGKNVGLTFVLEPAGPGAAGFGVSFTAEAVEVLYQMMKKATNR